MNAICPIAETADTITLTKADYAALLEALDEAKDLAAVRAVDAAVTAGQTEYLPIEMVEQLASGDHPLRVWRKYRGCTGKALAALAGVTQSYICEIENRRKPGSFDAMAKLARALRIDMADLEDTNGQDEGASFPD